MHQCACLLRSRARVLASTAFLLLLTHFTKVAAASQRWRLCSVAALVWFVELCRHARARLHALAAIL
jgi:hypothetical protein